MDKSLNKIYIDMQRRARTNSATQVKIIDDTGEERIYDISKGNQVARWSSVKKVFDSSNFQFERIELLSDNESLIYFYNHSDYVEDKEIENMANTENLSIDGSNNDFLRLLLFAQDSATKHSAIALKSIISSFELITESYTQRITALERMVHDNLDMVRNAAITEGLSQSHANQNNNAEIMGALQVLLKGVQSENQGDMTTEEQKTTETAQNFPNTGNLDPNFNLIYSFFENMGIDLKTFAPDQLIQIMNLLKSGKNINEILKELF